MNRLPVFATLLSFLPFAVWGANPDALPQVPEAFVQQLVAGINARDLTLLRPLIHPATLSCMRIDDEGYYAWWLWKDGSRRYTIAAGYQAQLVEPARVRKTASAQSGPFEPDYGLRFSYHVTPMSIMQRLFEISLKDGKAALIMECPTAEQLTQFRATAAEGMARKKKLERLWHTLSPQEKQAFALMAKGGMKLDGMQAAEQKYHLDSTESLAFMDIAEYADTP